MTAIEAKQTIMSIFDPEMKWTIPILMLLTMTMSFSKGIIWLEYQANKDYISQNLCINKAKPRLHCNGKCQMAKKMAEEENGNSTAPVPKLKTGFDESVLLYSNEEFKPLAQNKISKYNNFSGQPPYQSPVFSIFHPPA